MTAVVVLSWTPWAAGSFTISPSKEKRTNWRKETPLPPLPVPIEVQVANKGEVQVLLHTYGWTASATSFLIRNQPVFGKITHLDPVEQQGWLLTYQHTSDMNGELRLEDRILFVARNEKGVSSSTEILIHIVDNPPVLETAGLVEWGKIPAGVAATHSITVTNKGGGTLEGSVTAEAPWKVEPEVYHLRRDQQATLRLTLTPDASREYCGNLHFSSRPESPAILHANAFAPFTVEPATLDLAPKSPGHPARSGSFSLTNQTATDLTVQVQAPARLHLPRQIVLKPGAVESLQAALAPEDHDGLDETVHLTAGAVSQSLGVHTPPPEPNLPPPALPPPHGIPPLAPHSPAVADSGRAPLAAPPLPPPAPLALPPPPPEAPPSALNDLLEPLPKITGVAVLRTTSGGEAEFAWDPPAVSIPSTDLRYRVEIRRLGIKPDGQPEIYWVPVPKVQFTVSKGRMRAVFSGVPSGIRDSAHIVALNTADELCAQSAPFFFSTPPRVRLYTGRNLLLAGFTLLLAVGAALQWRQKRSLG